MIPLLVQQDGEEQGPFRVQDPGHRVHAPEGAGLHRQAVLNGQQRPVGEEGAGEADQCFGIQPVLTGNAGPLLRENNIWA